MKTYFFQKKSQKIMLVFLILLLVVPLVVFPQLSVSVLVSKWIYFSLVSEIAFLFCLSLFSWKSIWLRMKHPIVLLYLASAAWIAISSVLGIDPLNSFWGNAVRPGGWFLLFHFSLFFLFLLCLEKNIFEKSIRWFVGVGALVSLYAIFERMELLPVLGGHFDARTTSTIGNPIYLAGFLILPLSIAIFHACQKRKLWFYWVSTFVIAIGILTAWTRGAFLGIGIGVLIGSIFYVWNRFGWKLGVAVVACVSILGFVIVLNVSFHDRNILDRLGYWNIALQSAFDHPIKGLGYENYYRAAEKFYTRDLYAGEGTFIDKPHNQFLETLVTSGIVGVGLFIALIFAATRLLVKVYQDRCVSLVGCSVLLGGFMAFHVQNLFAFDTITTLFAVVYFLMYLIHIERANTSLSSMSFRKPFIQGVGFVFALLFVGAMGIFMYWPIGKYFHTVFLLNKTQTPEESFALVPVFSSFSFVYDTAHLGRLYKKRGNDLLGLNPVDLSNVDKFLDVSKKNYRIATEIHPLRGEYFYQLATVSMMHSAAHKQPMTENEKGWIKKSIDLMPGRVEPRITEAYAYVLDGDTQKAVAKLESLDKNYLNNPSFLWTLSLFYKQIGRTDDAAYLGYQAFEKNVRINTAAPFLWIADYYAQKQDFEKVVRLYQHAADLEPDNLSLLPNLIGAYVANNQTEKAIFVAEMIIKKDPLHADAAKEFIESTKKR